MSNIPAPPTEMRTITFNNLTLSTEINGCYTVDVTGPGVIPKQVNRIDVPGRDFAWDFGSHDKTDFQVTADLLIIADDDPETPAMTDKLQSLWAILDTEEAESLDIDGEPDYVGQVFEPPQITRSGQATRVVVTWLCREPTDQDI